MNGLRLLDGWALSEYDIFVFRYEPSGDAEVFI